MSNYKKIMLDKGIMSKELLDIVSRIDRRVDKSLLSKIINDICLPNVPTFKGICEFMNCCALDIYDVREIDLLNQISKSANINATNTVATARIDRGGLSHGENIYNLTVELNRIKAERIFNKQSLHKLGFVTKTDCIRSYVDFLDKKLAKIIEKEKAVKCANTQQDG